ncbi:hypothetical protein DIPPA_12014 [Diplonema papillatum]|nr:hypothetical protein DIPPA_12014 [Diplonema papillatum]
MSALKLSHAGPVPFSMLVLLSLAPLFAADCVESSLNLSGFSDPQYNNRYWARHPTREISGKPTYWTGRSQTHIGWTDTGTYYLFWCSRGGEAWAIGGPDIDQRTANFEGGACHHLAMKADSTELEEEGKWTETIGGAPTQTESDVKVTDCGIQLKSCEDACRGFPVGMAFDSCIPMFKCGVQDPSSGYIRIVMTEEDQQDFKSVTLLGYQDSECLHTIPEAAVSRETLVCNECSSAILPGNVTIPCYALDALHTDVADGLPGIGVVVCVILLITLWIYLYMGWLYLKMRKDRRPAGQEGREGDAESALLDSPRSPYTPPASELESTAPQSQNRAKRDPAADARRVKEITAKLEEFYSSRAPNKASTAGSTAKRAVAHSATPERFLYDVLSDKYPDDTATLRRIFDVSPGNSKNPMTRTATPPTVDDVEDALRESERNRMHRLQSWSNDGEAKDSSNGMPEPKATKKGKPPKLTAVARAREDPPIEEGAENGLTTATLSSEGRSGARSQQSEGVEASTPATPLWDELSAKIDWGNIDTKTDAESAVYIASTPTRKRRQVNNRRASNPPTPNKLRIPATLEVNVTSATGLNTDDELTVLLAVQGQKPRSTGPAAKGPGAAWHQTVYIAIDKDDLPIYLLANIVDGADDSVATGSKRLTTATVTSGTKPVKIALKPEGELTLTIAPYVDKK